MFKFLIKGLQAGLVATLMADYRLASLHMLRIEATTACVRGVQMARLSALGLMVMGCLIGLLCVGVVLVHVGIFVLLPWSVAVKALVAVGLGVVYVLAAWVGLRLALDEKTWMNKTGVTELINKAISPPHRRLT